MAAVRPVDAQVPIQPVAAAESEVNPIVRIARDAINPLIDGFNRVFSWKHIGAFALAAMVTATLVAFTGLIGVIAVATAVALSVLYVYLSNDDAFNWKQVLVCIAAAVIAAGMIAFFSFSGILPVVGAIGIAILIAYGLHHYWPQRLN